MINNCLYRNSIFSDNPNSVQLVVTEVTSQVAQADSLMQTQDPSSDTYQSLQTIKNMMETLASALQSYLSLLLSGRRMRRNTGIVFSNYYSLAFFNTSFSNIYIQFTILVCGKAQQQFDQLRTIETFIINTINNINRLEDISNRPIAVLEFERATKLVLNKDLRQITYQMKVIQETCRFTTSP